MPRTIVVFALLCAASISSAYAQLFIDQGVDISSTRTSAIGGPHVALADDLTTLFANPAGFRAAGPEMSFADLTLGLSGKIFDIGNLAIQIMNGVNPMLLLMDPDVLALFTNMYTAASLNGPIAIGYVGDGLGFGVFNTTGILMSTVGTIPTITASVEENLVFQGGYSFRIPLPEDWLSTFDIGLIVKTFVQGKVLMTQSILGLLSMLATLNPAVLLGTPFTLGMGAGLDFGIRYSWNDWLAVGIVGRNLPTFTMRNQYASVAGFLGGAAPTTAYGYVPIDLSAGIMVTPHFGVLDTYISHLKICFDYSNILDFLLDPAGALNPLLHMGLGMEFAMLEILYFRGGFSGGYLNAGLGFDLTFLRLDFAVFGSELSTQPGMRPLYNILLGVQLKI